MISSSPRIYNRDRWIEFLVKCLKYAVPIELVIYHENMLKGSARYPLNFVSRFRPFPKIFGKVLSLKKKNVVKLATLKSTYKYKSTFVRFQTQHAVLSCQREPYLSGHLTTSCKVVDTDPVIKTYFFHSSSNDLKRSARLFVFLRNFTKLLRLTRLRRPE